MVNALTLLIACQFIGEVVARSASLPVPGPVLGMVLLLGLLVMQDRRGARGIDPALKSTAHSLLSHMSLLFIPAGVGVVTQLGVLERNWLPVLAATLVSTFLGLLVTGWLMHRLAPAETAADAVALAQLALAQGAALAADADAEAGSET